MILRHKSYGEFNPLHCVPCRDTLETIVLTLATVIVLDALGVTDLFFRIALLM